MICSMSANRYLTVSRNYLWGLLRKNWLSDDPQTIDEYMEIVDDYMLTRKQVKSVLKKAKELCMTRKNFDECSFIAYGFIAMGKDGDLNEKGEVYDIRKN